MAKEEVLTQLKDIHLPSSVSWWPLAPGWYVVLVIIILLIISMIALIYKKHLNALAKKQALVLLNIYTDQYAKDRDAQLASARISELLKRVALVYYPRQDVASIHGDAWIDFLNQTGKGVDFKPIKTMLLDLPFKSAESVNLKPLITQAQRWIKQRRVPCSN